jgi:hypothetical protein
MLDKRFLRWWERGTIIHRLIVFACMAMRLARARVLRTSQRVRDFRFDPPSIIGGFPDYNPRHRRNFRNSLLITLLWFLLGPYLASTELPLPVALFSLLGVVLSTSTTVILLLTNRDGGMINELFGG